MLPESSSSMTTSTSWALAVILTCWLCPGNVPAVVSGGFAACAGPALGGVYRTTRSFTSPGGTVNGGAVRSSSGAAGAGSTAVTTSGAVPRFATCTLCSILRSVEVPS